MGIFSSDAAKAAQAKRDREANAALARRGSGSFLSWGGSGRTETRPGFFGLGQRERHDMEQENARSGWFGIFGGKAVASRAARADRSGRSRSTKSSSWFSS